MNNPANKLIMLFGMPRSGTTWVGKIFDSHPDLLYLHEPDSVFRLNDIPVFEEAENSERYQQIVSNYVERLPQCNDPKITTKRPWFNKHYVGKIRDSAYKTSALFASVANRISTNIQLPTVSRISSGNLSKATIGWKSIESLGRLGVLTNCIPQSRVVHIVRHPCGQIASVLRGEKQGKFNSSTASAEDRDFYNKLFSTRCANKYGLSPVSFDQLSVVERLAWRWVIINEKAIEETKDNSSVVFLNYGELCANPIEITKQLFEFCGLDWNEQTAAFLGDSTASNNTAYYSVFKDPLAAGNKWRQDLDAESQRIIATIVESSDVLRQIFRVSDSRPTA